MPQPGSSLNTITGREMSEPAGPQGPICHPSRSCAFPYPYLFPRSRVWFSAHSPLALSTERCPGRTGDLVPDKVPGLLPSPLCPRHVPEAAGSSLPTGKVHLNPYPGQGPCCPSHPMATRLQAEPEQGLFPWPTLCPALPTGTRPVPRLVGQGLCPVSAPGVCQGAMPGVEGQALPRCWWGCLGALLMQTTVAAGQPACAVTIPTAPTVEAGGYWLRPPSNHSSATSLKVGDAGPPQAAHPSGACQTLAEHPHLPGAEMGSRRLYKVLQPGGCRSRLAPRRLTARAADSLIDRVA